MLLCCCAVVLLLYTVALLQCCAVVLLCCYVVVLLCCCAVLLPNEPPLVTSHVACAVPSSRAVGLHSTRLPSTAAPGNPAAQCCATHVHCRHTREETTGGLQTMLPEAMHGVHSTHPPTTPSLPPPWSDICSLTGSSGLLARCAALHCAAPHCMPLHARDTGNGPHSLGTRTSLDSHKGPHLHKPGMLHTVPHSPAIRTSSPPALPPPRPPHCIPPPPSPGMLRSSFTWRAPTGGRCGPRSLLRAGWPA